MGFLVQAISPSIADDMVVEQNLLHVPLLIGR
jgi:hypothetical protein